MTIQILGGLVSVEDGNPASDSYDPKRKVRIELRFDTADANFIDGLNLAAAAASAKVDQLLGRPVRGVELLMFGDGPPAEVEQPVLLGTTEPEKPKARRPRNPPAVAPPPAGEAPADPPTATGEAGASNPADEWETPAPAPDKIEDADLNSACAKANARLKDVAKVKETIARFCPEGIQPKAALIPQDKRADFIKALELLV